MLSLETRDIWGFNLTVTVGASTEVYANTATSAYATILAFVAWANHATRAWTGTITFGWSWERQSGTGGAILTLMASGYFTLDGGATATLGFAAMAFPDLSVVGDTAALGTWAPKTLGLSRYYRFLDDAGDASATGAIRPGTPSKAGYRPEVEAVGTAQDAARLTYVLGRASNPRRAWVWRKDSNTWIYLAVGAVDRSLDGNLFTFTFDARGHA
jgi:hypothetical protein